MANPIALAAALARLVQIKCPHCGYQKRVPRKPVVATRVCGSCKRKFSDPLAVRKKK